MSFNSNWSLTLLSEALDYQTQFLRYADAGLRAAFGSDAAEATHKYLTRQVPFSRFLLYFAAIHNSNSPDPHYQEIATFSLAVVAELEKLHQLLGNFPKPPPPREAEAFIALLSHRLQLSKVPSLKLSHSAGFLIDEVDPTNEPQTISMPMVFTQWARYWPLLAHELAHAFLKTHDGQTLTNKVYALVAKDPTANGNVIHLWIKEWLCDAIGLIVTGPAYYPALIYTLLFLESNLFDTKHPPARLRIDFLDHVWRQMYAVLEPPGLPLNIDWKLVFHESHDDSPSLTSDDLSALTGWYYRNKDHVLQILHAEFHCSHCVRQDPDFYTNWKELQGSLSNGHLSPVRREYPLPEYLALQAYLTEMTFNASDDLRKAIPKLFSMVKDGFRDIPLITDVVLASSWKTNNIESRLASLSHVELNEEIIRNFAAQSASHHVLIAKSLELALVIPKLLETVHASE